MQLSQCIFMFSILCQKEASTEGGQLKGMFFKDFAKIDTKTLLPESLFR